MATQVGTNDLLLNQNYEVHIFHQLSFGDATHP